MKLIVEIEISYQKLEIEYWYQNFKLKFKSNQKVKSKIKIENWNRIEEEKLKSKVRIEIKKWNWKYHSQVLELVCCEILNIVLYSMVKEFLDWKVFGQFCLPGDGVWVYNNSKTCFITS